LLQRYNDEVQTHRQKLQDVPLAQAQRLAYIDFRIYFLGELRRSDLTERFQTGPAGATRDIAMYRSLAPENLDFDGTTKVYLPSSSFKPLFEQSAGQVLTALSEGFGDGVNSAQRPLLPCEFPVALSLPPVSVLAPITRAIHRRKAVRLTYHSRTSGPGEREIVPLALVSIGTRWHARVFDRKSSTFRDFVLTRMLEPRVLEDSPVRDEETAQADLQWSRVIELELVPHPDFESTEVVLMDYPMDDGVLKVRVRAANAGYMLQQWHVDCSPDHSLRGRQYALWLRDSLALYGSETALLAPGYQDPRAKRDAGPTKRGAPSSAEQARS
jgi:hypothetical protein